MKIEKLSDNKVKLTLSLEELKERSIDVKDLKKDTARAQEVLWDLITEAELDREFEIDDSQLLVEAYTANDSSFVVTVTRLNNTDTNDMYNSLDFRANKHIKVVNYANCFAFDSLQSLIAASKVITNSNIYIGKSNLYYYNNKYYLCFSKYTSKLIKARPMFYILSEYGETPKYIDLFETLLKEKGKLIYSGKSIIELAKY